MSELWHEEHRVLAQLALAEGASYQLLAEMLNAEMTTSPRGAAWTKHSAYNLCRKLGLSSLRPCRAQPRASMTQRSEGLRRVTSALEVALRSGTLTEIDLTGSPEMITAKLGISPWLWERHGLKAALALRLPLSAEILH